MDSIDSQLALADNIEFEEKVDIETLVFPSKPMNIPKTEFTDMEEEMFENAKPLNKEINNGKNYSKLKMEEGILKLCQELDKEKSENPMMDISQTRSLKIRQFVETIGEYDEYENQKLQEIVSLKAKIMEITEEHKIAMSLNAKNMNSIVKMHEKAQEALDDKSNEIINIKIKSKKSEMDCKKDEHPRGDLKLEDLKKLKTVFKENGTVTPGNSSGLNDGAAALVLMTREKAELKSLEILASIVSWSSSGVEPSLMGLGPIPSIKEALIKAQWQIEDVDLFEINEAFAAQTLAEKGVTPDQVGDGVVNALTRDYSDLMKVINKGK